eukprot:177329-Chlamydomonas_euryale.AAC.2
MLPTRHRGALRRSCLVSGCRGPLPPRPLPWPRSRQGPHTSRMARDACPSCSNRDAHDTIEWRRSARASAGGRRPALVPASGCTLSRRGAVVSSKPVRKVRALESSTLNKSDARSNWVGVAMCRELHKCLGFGSVEELRVDSARAPRRT